MSVQIDTETTALTGAQRLYAAMEEFVDPYTYHGSVCSSCLFGKVAVALGIEPWALDADAQVAAHFGVDRVIAARIYNGVVHEPYQKDFYAAMQMAAEELGLAPTGKEERCRE